MMVRIRITKRAIAQIVFLLAFAAGGALNPLPPGAKASPVEGKGKYAGMILIPAGPFTMGRDTGPVSERPAHKLFLPAFYIDKNLVTAEKYAKFIRAKGPAGPNGEMYLDVADPDALVSLHNGVWMANAGSENNPAGEMSWHGALAYCKWLGKRLPSEAEWEKAARGTDGRLYPWGSQKPTHELAVIGLFRGDTLPIGQRPKGASPYGVLDMAGQVWEWTRSIPRPYPYEPRDGREKAHAGGGPRRARGKLLERRRRYHRRLARVRRPLAGGHRARLPGLPVRGVGRAGIPARREIPPGCQSAENIRNCCQQFGSHRRIKA